MTITTNQSKATAVIPDKPSSIHRRIRFGYFTGLCLVACLVITGQVLVHKILDEQEGTANLINIAGRQRMLSQKIVKAALEGQVAELEAATGLWFESHHSLVNGDTKLSISGDYTDSISSQYAALEPFVYAIKEASEALTKNTDNLSSGSADHSINILLSNENEYLVRMDNIVHAHAEQGELAIARLDRVELFLGGFTLLILVLEALFIFEPMVRRLRSSLNQIQESENRFSLAAKGSSGVIFDWDLANDSIYLAPSYKDLLGIHHTALTSSPNELLGRIRSQHLPIFSQQLATVIEDPNKDLDIEVLMSHSDGSERWVLCRGAEHRDQDGKADRFVGSLADITELKQSQIKLRELAERDALTGLANRSFFSDKLEVRIARNAKNLKPFSVMFLDFDRFKMINDSLGHDVGDGLLISFAKRISGMLDDSATIARFGGDEFAVLVEADSEYELLEIGRSLITELSDPHQVGRHEIVSTASIGMVMQSPRYSSSEHMLRDADIAMYEAKRSGRAKLVVFDEAMHETIVEQQRIESELKRKNVTDQMHLVYQPIMSLDTGSVTGFEALVRWKHPTEGNIAPDKFITIAEECGAIDSIGQWILRSAVEQFHNWDTAHDSKKLTIAINISRKQLLSPELIDQLKQVSTDYPSLTHRIIIEVTETAVVDERLDVTSILEEINTLGFQIAMDDFGTGYSSLSCLHNYPIKYLKIDRSFVKNLEDRREFTAVFAAIVSLSNALELKVVAEGIETDQQLVQLQAMGCQFGQGYFFYQPLSVEDATSLLEGGNTQELKNAA